MCNLNFFLKGNFNRFFIDCRTNGDNKCEIIGLK